jgi:hypothetical protein
MSLHDPKRKRRSKPPTALPIGQSLSYFIRQSYGDGHVLHDAALVCGSACWSSSHACDLDFGSPDRERALRRSPNCIAGQSTGALSPFRERLCRPAEGSLRKPLQAMGKRPARFSILVRPLRTNLSQTSILRVRLPQSMSPVGTNAKCRPSGNVRVPSQSGRHLFGMSISHFDPNRTFQNFGRGGSLARFIRERPRAGLPEARE